MTYICHDHSKTICTQNCQGFFAITITKLSSGGTHFSQTALIFKVVLYIQRKGFMLDYLENHAILNQIVGALLEVGLDRDLKGWVCQETHTINLIVNMYLFGVNVSF